MYGQVFFRRWVAGSHTPESDRVLRFYVGFVGNTRNVPGGKCDLRAPFRGPSGITGTPACVIPGASTRL